MNSWIIYALLASLSWGSYIVIAKFAFAKGDLNPFVAALATGIGVLGFFGILYLTQMQNAPFTNLEGIGISIVAGAVWALGQVFAIMAIVNKAPVAKLVPLYNTNTLIAVLIGIILLKELPAGTEKIKVLIGAVLIVIGGIMVSA